MRITRKKIERGLGNDGTMSIEQRILLGVGLSKGKRPRISDAINQKIDEHDYRLFLSMRPPDFILPDFEPCNTNGKFRWQYSHPNWHKMRYAIIERDAHKCQACGNGSDLQVHHIRYYGPFIWSVKSSDLITLCNKCHADHHNVKEC